MLASRAIEETQGAGSWPITFLMKSGKVHLFPDVCKGSSITVKDAHPLALVEGILVIPKRPDSSQAQTAGLSDMVNSTFNSSFRDHTVSVLQCNKNHAAVDEQSRFCRQEEVRQRYNPEFHQQLPHSNLTVAQDFRYQLRKILCYNGLDGSDRKGDV